MLAKARGRAGNITPLYVSLCISLIMLLCVLCSALEGCKAIIMDLQLPQNQYQVGKTKIFLKDPETLFSLEDLYYFYFYYLFILIKKIIYNCIFQV